jgi:hypothetical protein
MTCSLKNIRRILALLAAISILPVLAPAQSNQGGNNQGGNNQGGNNQGISPAPEANTGIVLIPFIGAVLVFSAFQLLRAKSAQKNS